MRTDQTELCEQGTHWQEKKPRHKMDDYNDNNTAFPDSEFPHNIDYTDKTAYLAAQGVLVALAFILNIVVIVVVVCLCVKWRGVREGAAHVIPMLACCVAQLLFAVSESVFINILRVRRRGEDWPLTCHQIVALELTFFMLTALYTLLVAAVIFVQVVQRQKVMTLTRAAQKMVAVVAVVLSLLYVVVVVVALFYKTFLEDDSSVCVEWAPGKELVNFQSDDNLWRVLPSCTYVVPSLLIVLCCVLLLLVHCSSRGNNDDSPQRPFPINALLAGVACVLLGFAIYFYIVGNSHLPSHLAKARLWLAGRTLQTLTGVVVPVFWLLDAHIRALCCRRGNAAWQTTSDWRTMAGETTDGVRGYDNPAMMKTSL